MESHQDHFKCRYTFMLNLKLVCGGSGFSLWSRCNRARAASLFYSGPDRSEINSFQPHPFGDIESGAYYDDIEDLSVGRKQHKIECLY